MNDDDNNNITILIEIYAMTVYWYDMSPERPTAAEYPGGHQAGHLYQHLYCQTQCCRDGEYIYIYRATCNATDDLTILCIYVIAGATEQNQSSWYYCILQILATQWWTVSTKTLTDMLTSLAVGLKTL